MTLINHIRVFKGPSFKVDYPGPQCLQCSGLLTMADLDQSPTTAFILSVQAGAILVIGTALRQKFAVSLDAHIHITISLFQKRTRG